jgi:endonuclease G
MNMPSSRLLRHALATLLLAASVLLAAPLQAPPSQAAPASDTAGACQDQFFQGLPPTITSAALRDKTRGLCSENFALAHSGVFHTPLWVAEHLTRANIESARGLRRNNAFHPDPRLPRGERAELSDYARSGYDRGHMAPSGDMPSGGAQYDSFSLANMVPQNPDNNRGVWAGIEAAVRDLAERNGEAYVVTGPIYTSATLRTAGRVAIPDALFKAVFLPGKGAAVYVVDNAAHTNVRTYSVAEAEAALHLDLFPGMPPEVKARKLELPAPEKLSFGGHGHTRR